MSSTLAVICRMWWSSSTLRDGLTEIWRDKPRLVQITIRWFRCYVRLSCSLCGKATPFRCRETLNNLIRAAEGIAFAAARMRRKGGRWAGKAEPFRIAVGEAPFQRHNRSLTWTALGLVLPLELLDFLGAKITQGRAELPPARWKGAHHAIPPGGVAWQYQSASNAAHFGG